jgi:predicted RNA methylase
MKSELSRSEKKSEIDLYECLKLFNKKYIFFTPFENEKLKEMFKKCSKSGNGIGIPDRIYYDNKTLIIFECKSNDLNKAEKDIFHYVNNLEKLMVDEIYGVAFVDKNIYSIRKFMKCNNEIKNELIDKVLKPLTFNIQKEISQNRTLNINKHIHKIHNYIRDNTKISNEDKGFFMAIILMSLNKKSFRNFIQNYNEKEFIYDYLKENLLEFDIDPSVFEFLKKDYTTNKHFYNIINMVLEIYNLNFHENIDLLNVFYNEFIKYSNTDSKSLGIVLTPDYIVELMVYLLNINADDVVLDLCSGTGSFLLESLKYKPKRIVGCEIQKKLFTLLKCNLILRNVKKENYLIKYNNCFEEEFEATKSIINPPFGMKDKNELDFVLKQIKSVKNGLVCAIFPISCISNNKKNYNLKKEIMEKATIKIIINLSNKVFYPNASVECCIMLLNTSEKHKEKDKVLFVDYRDDGIEIKKHVGKIKKELFNEKFEDIKEVIKDFKRGIINSVNSKSISVNDEWNNFNNERKNTSISEFKLKMLEHEFIKKKIDIIQNADDIDREIDLSSNVKYMFFKLIDLFDIKTIKRITKEEAENNKGTIPYISASEKEHGITCLTNIMTHKKNTLTLSNSGSVGSCFYQTHDFCGTDSIFNLELKKFIRNKMELNGINIDKFYIYLSLNIELQLKNKYSFGRALRMNKIIENKEGIYLPVKNENDDNIDNINYEFLNNLLEKI